MASEFMHWFVQGFRQESEDLNLANASYNQALEHLGQASHPQLPALLGNLANNHRALGNLPAMWHFFERTRELALQSPASIHPNTWAQLAWILYQHGTDAQQAQALELVERAFAAGEERLAVRDTQMRILLRLGREAEARAVAVAALRLDWKHRDFQDVKARFGLRSPEDLGPTP